MVTYIDAVEKIWPRHDDDSPPTTKTKEEIFLEIVRYATLAPNSHNTQPWKFQLSPDENTITVLPDLSRSCSVVDPDDHHLFVTLGCAVENALIAAKAFGLNAKRVDTSDPQNNGIKIELEPCEKEATELFWAIPKRQCTRSDYDGKPLQADELKQLQEAAADESSGVRVVLVTDPAQMATVKDFVLQANMAQFNNKDWRMELKKWVRFNAKEAIQTGDGMYKECVGNTAPSIPRWLGNLIFDFVVDPENEKMARHVDSSAGIAIFLSDKDDPTHWVEVGRCYERFVLQATAMGVKNAFVNQPIEEADIRPSFQKALGLDEQGVRADLVVRFGRTDQEFPKSLRRPVKDIVVQ